MTENIAHDGSAVAKIVGKRCIVVKNPSQFVMETLITKTRNAKKSLVDAGCVPQGSRDLKDLALQLNRIFQAQTVHSHHNLSNKSRGMGNRVVASRRVGCTSIG